MGNYRKRPKGSYIEEATWEELYSLTKLWKSDIEFYKDDSKFLHHLMDKYFIWIIEKDATQVVKTLQDNLKKIDEKCEDLLTKIDQHLLQLAHLVEQPDWVEGRIFRLEHTHLEDEFHEFTAFFRGNRMSIFTAVEGVVLNEKVRHLLGNLIASE